MNWLRELVRNFIGSVSKEEWIRSTEIERQKSIALQRQMLTDILNQMQAQAQAVDSMTPRDMFAAQSLTGLRASGMTVMAGYPDDFVADKAFLDADAMMRARAKQ